MKRWAILTVLLYLLILLLMTVPMALLYGVRWWFANDGSVTTLSEVSLHEALATFRDWGYWMWLAVMVLCQALLLVVPVGVAERRLTPRRHVLVPVVTTAFLLSNILFFAGFSILCAAKGDDAIKLFEAMGRLFARSPLVTGTARRVGFVPSNDAFRSLVLAGVVVALWLMWGLVFYRFAKTDEPEALVKRTTSWLLRGSILELLVAVPSHIIVRGRNDCCAPAGTFWGITTGLTVMLLSFGPGVFFLFVERMHRLRPRQPRAESSPTAG